MNAEQHAARAEGRFRDALGGELDVSTFALTSAIVGLGEALLASRPIYAELSVGTAEIPPMPALFLDQDGDLWVELPDGEHVAMLDRETGHWDGARERASVERAAYGPLRPVPGVPS